MNRKSKFNRQVEFTFANEIGNKNVEKRCQAFLKMS